MDHVLGLCLLDSLFLNIYDDYDYNVQGKKIKKEKVRRKKVEKMQWGRREKLRRVGKAEIRCNQ